MALLFEPGDSLETLAVIAGVFVLLDGIIEFGRCGLEFLRNKAVKDFPNETWDGATDRWGSALRARFGGSS